MKILNLLLILLLVGCARKDLNSAFNNALISDLSNNITRDQNIVITEVDIKNKRLKTNYTKLSDLTIEATGGESWFVCQGNQAGKLFEITSVDTISGWITYKGANMKVGTKVEFFNPFVNYQFVPSKKPLFDPYPKKVGGKPFHYIHSGGLIEKADGTYVLLCPVVVGKHASRSIYYATSPDLENWTFIDKKLLSTDMISFAKTVGNVHSVGNPMKLKNDNYLVLLAVEQTNRNYTSAYMIMDENLNIIQQPQEIMIDGWNGAEQSSSPLSITKFKKKYRLLLHRKYPNNIDMEVHEVIINGKREADLFNALDNGVIESSTMIHKGTTSSGYLAGKVDDASYLEYNNELYLIIGGESQTKEWVTHQNREYGLAKLVEGSWQHDVRSPLINNPVQLHKKYPDLNWAWEHLGGNVSPIIKNGYLYMFMAAATDNPDYYLCGIKTKLE